MQNDDIIIRYHGFSPSEFSKPFIENLMQEILYESPYDSQLYATFTKVDDHYKVILSISSSAGPFFAVAYADYLHEAARKLNSQIHRRLMKWKSKRFRLETIKNKMQKNLKYLDGDNDGTWTK